MKINKTFISYAIISLVILFVFIAALPILSHFKVWEFPDIFSVFKEAANLLYLISGFLLVIGLVIAYFQLNLLKEQVTDQLRNTHTQIKSAEEQIKNTKEQLHYIKEDMRLRNHSAAVEKSIEYLHIFAKDIIPQMNKYYRDYPNKEKIKISNWNPSEFDYKLDIFALPEQERYNILKELEKRREYNLVDILNQFEFFSAGIMNGLGKEDIVYDPISTSFIDFISSEIVELSSQRHLGYPFTNTVELYKLWTTRRKVALQSTDIHNFESILNSKKRSLHDLESSYSPPKYIGQ